MLLLAGVAFAQQALELASDATELQPCLDTPACEGVLTGLASETLVQLGYFMTNDPLAGSALIGRGTGVVIELHADSYVLGERNLITEQVAIPPLLPKLELAFQLGSYTYDDPYPQLAVGLSAFPPVKVDGYQVLNLTGTASGAVPLYEHFLWAGAELAVSHGNVRGEMLGDGSDLEDVGSVAPFIDLETPACADTVDGCEDRVRQTAFTGRVGLAVDPHPAVFLYTKVGLTRLGTHLDIAFDESEWRMRGSRAEFSYGGGVRIADRVLLGIGGVTGTKSEAVSSDDGRTLTRFHVGLSVRTGDARYWYEEAPEEAAMEGREAQ